MNRLLVMALTMGNLKMDEIPPGGPPAGGGAPPAGGNPPVDWQTGVNETHKGVITSKGWKDLNSVMDSYTGLEKLLGGPKEKLVRIPDNMGDEKAMGEIYDRFGRPKEAKDYSFKGADEGFDKFARETFHKNGLSSTQAKNIIEGYDAFAKGLDEAAESKFKAESQIATDTLKTKWASAYDQNLKIAKSAATQFGISNEDLGKLESTLGFAKTMDFLHGIGSKVGEAEFHGGSGGPAGGNGILAPAQALAKISALSKDTEFFKKLNSGDVESKVMWENLNKMAVGTYGQ